jgi:hypothetical protein
MANGEAFDLSVFHEPADMDTTIAALHTAGASEEAAMSVHDPVRSGAYQMPSVVTEGGYAIMHISPIIVHERHLDVEPIEFGACRLVPEEEVEWSRTSSEEIAAGNKAMPGSLNLVQSRNLKRLSSSLIFKLAPLIGGVKLNEIKDTVSDLPAHMVGGIVTGVRFHPPPDELETSAIPYWHRAVPLALDREEMIRSAPRFASSKVKEIFQNPDLVAGLALVRLFNEAVVKETVTIDEVVTLGFPPKRFIE